ncbi:MAG: aminotransferase class V-fold PLP-dependent enzyme [Clostridia bacterium]|nr:aminotransferase class V-fold PLP-dependent enzyme [Clostridia bacterium]
MIYLDNAATSFPKPEGVWSACGETLRRWGGNPGRSGHLLAMRASEEIFRTRSLLASLFHTQPEQIIFTANATHALNLAIKGLLHPGDHVVISPMEHNSVMRPLTAAQVRWTAADYVFEDDEATVRSFERAITPETKAIVCTHASNVLGCIFPVEKLEDLCREKGILFLCDASQSAGILPISGGRGHSAWCMPGHKGLLGPQGTGVLILGEALSPRTWIEGGSGTNSTEFLPPEEWPERFEAGTPNTPGIAGLGAGVHYVLKHGESIRKNEKILLEKLHRCLRAIAGVHVYGSPCNSVCTVSFNVTGLFCGEVASRLDEQGFACARVCIVPPPPTAITEHWKRAPCE